MSDILVPIDGSRVALRAVEHASGQAKSKHAVVHLLNVEPELDDYGMVRAYISRKKHREVTAARASAVLAPAASILRRARVRCETHVVYGNAPQAIIRTARRLKCDSIVMGTRGLGAMGNVFLGSVASKVIHLSPVPVTLIR